MRMRDLAKPDSALPPSLVSPSDKWVVIESDVVGERILVIRHRRWLPEARKTHPDLAIYFTQEIKNLERFKGSDEDVRTIHKVKKRFKAWIIR